MMKLSKQIRKLKLKNIVGYLPYGLKGVLIHDMREDFMLDDWVVDLNIFKESSIWTYAGYVDEDLSLPLGEGDFSGFLIRYGNSYTSIGKSIKPILRPLSDLKEFYNKFKFSREAKVFIDKLKTINKYTVRMNIPYDIVQDEIMSQYFDVYGLIESGLAIDVNTLDNNPYK